MIDLILVDGLSETGDGIVIELLEDAGQAPILLIQSYEDGYSKQDMVIPVEMLLNKIQSGREFIADLL